MIKKFSILLLALVASPLLSAEELFPDFKPRPFILGDALEVGATIGGYPIWQGEAKWQIADLSTTDSSGSADSVPIGTAQFFQVEGKQFVAAMQVTSNLQTGNGAYWVGEPCKRDDMLFKLELAGGRENNCVTINHIASYMSNPGGKLAELYALLKEKGVDMPPTVLKIELTRNGRNSKRLYYSIWINPEVVGFQRESETGWGRNPWNKTMSFNDPAKKQYIDALSNWATNFVKQMDEGLKQKPDAFASVPSWRTITNGIVKIKSAK